MTRNLYSQILCSIGFPQSVSDRRHGSSLNLETGFRLAILFPCSCTVFKLRNRRISSVMSLILLNDRSIHPNLQGSTNNLSTAELSPAVVSSLLLFSQKDRVIYFPFFAFVGLAPVRLTLIPESEIFWKEEIFLCERSIGGAQLIVSVSVLTDIPSYLTFSVPDAMLSYVLVT